MTCTLYVLWFNFIRGWNFIFLCFKLIIISYHTQKQRKINSKHARTKFNHNICVQLSHLLGQIIKKSKNVVWLNQGWIIYGKIVHCRPRICRKADHCHIFTAIYYVILLVQQCPQGRFLFTCSMIVSQFVEFVQTSHLTTVKISSEMGQF